LATIRTARKFPPRRRLTIDWLWQTLWGELPDVPTAEELLREAPAYDAQFPETQEARRRREQPDWLAEKLGFLTENASAECWRRIEQWSMS
jgi:hypothetical protein